MRTRFLLLLLLLPFTSPGQLTNLRQELWLRGAVKTLTEKVQLASEVKGEIIPGEMTSWREFQFLQNSPDCKELEYSVYPNNFGKLVTIKTCLYNTAGQLVEIRRELARDSTQTSSHLFTYDPEGRWVREKTTDHGVEEPHAFLYLMDSLGRFASMTRVDGQKESSIRFTYSHDAAGNLVEETSDFLLVNTAMKYNYLYDGDQKLLSETYRLIEEGEVTQLRVHTYQYNAQGFLVGETYEEEGDFLQITHENDASGNITRSIKKIGGKVVSMFVRTIEYW